MLTLERRKLELSLYGESYELTFPTLKQTQDYALKAQGASDNEAGELLVELLDGLGLPREVALGMEAEHLTQVIEHLMPSKKK